MPVLLKSSTDTFFKRNQNNIKIKMSKKLMFKKNEMSIMYIAHGLKNSHILAKIWGFIHHEPGGRINYFYTF